jgi:general secretion pathway protein G
MNKRMKRRYFTLMEMVVVIAIIALLAAVVTPMYFKHVKRARVSSAKTQIKMIEQAIMDYQLDNGAIPRSLNDLITNQSGAKKWDGPYLKSSTVPKDPWGNDYSYDVPGRHGSFDIYTYGEKGSEGGSERSGVIGNWD